MIFQIDGKNYMILDTLVVIEPPDDTWLTRLRQNHFVYCVKQKCFAKVEWAWEPPDPGTISGRIGIKFCWRSGDSWGLEHSQSWWIKSNGVGFDGKYLLYPIEGNCPDEAGEISDVWVRHVERTLSQLVARIDQLESQVDNLDNRRKNFY